MPDLAGSLPHLLKVSASEKSSLTSNGVRPHLLLALHRSPLWVIFCSMLFLPSDL